MVVTARPRAPRALTLTLTPARAADWTTEQMQAEAEEGWAEDWDDVRGGRGARGWGAARRGVALSPSRACAGRAGGAARRGALTPPRPAPPSRRRTPTRTLTRCCAPSSQRSPRRARRRQRERVRRPRARRQCRGGGSDSAAQRAGLGRCLHWCAPWFLRIEQRSAGAARTEHGPAASRSAGEATPGAADSAACRPSGGAASPARAPRARARARCAHRARAFPLQK